MFIQVIISILMQVLYIFEKFFTFCFTFEQNLQHLVNVKRKNFNIFFLYLERFAKGRKNNIQKK